MTTTTPHPEGIGYEPEDHDYRMARTAVVVHLHGDPYGMGWQLNADGLRGQRLTEIDQVKPGDMDYGPGELAEIARNWERPTGEELLQMMARQLGYHVFKCDRDEAF